MITRSICIALLVIGLIAGPVPTAEADMFENYSGDCTGEACASFLHGLWLFVNCYGSGRVFPFC